jgi:hypothetical protein
VSVALLNRDRRSAPTIFRASAHSWVAPPDAPVPDVLEQQWTAIKSYDLERLIRESDIKVERFVWGG